MKAELRPSSAGTAIILLVVDVLMREIFFEIFATTMQQLQSETKALEASASIYMVWNMAYL